MKYSDLRIGQFIQTDGRIIKITTLDTREDNYLGINSNGQKWYIFIKDTKLITLPMILQEEQDYPRASSKFYREALEYLVSQI